MTTSQAGACTHWNPPPTFAGEPWSPPPRFGESGLGQFSTEPHAVEQPLDGRSQPDMVLLPTVVERPCTGGHNDEVSGLSGRPLSHRVLQESSAALRVLAVQHCRAPSRSQHGSPGDGPALSAG